MNAFVASILFLGTTAAVVANGGQLVFANFGGGMSPAPIFDASGNPIPAPSSYVADLFWSANTNTSMDSLTPAGRNAAFTQSYPGVGYFFGGTVTLPSPTLDILGQVRVWDTSYGSTYYEARDNGGEFGFSNLIPVRLVSGGGTSPYPLFGLQSFQLQRLPHLNLSLTPTNTVLISWPVEGITYALQQNTNLSANWVTLTNTPLTVGQQNQMALPVGQAGSSFYRLISQ